MCDIDHCLVVAKGKERLAVSKQRSYRFQMGKFNLNKLNKVDVKESIIFRSKIGLHLWKIWMLRWK
jgi:hypothetical protein